MAHVLPALSPLSLHAANHDTRVVGCWGDAYKAESDRDYLISDVTCLTAKFKSHQQRKEARSQLTRHTSQTPCQNLWIEVLLVWFLYEKEEEAALLACPHPLHERRW